MIDPSDLIARLDERLAEAGDTVIVRRYTAPSGNPRPKIDVPDVPATVRSVRAEDLVGNIDQTWSKIVLSPTMIATLLPLKKNDKVMVRGQERNVEIVKPISIQNVIVRVDLMVSG